MRRRREETTTLVTGISATSTAKQGVDGEEKGARGDDEGAMTRRGCWSVGHSEGRPTGVKGCAHSVRDDVWLRFVVVGDGPRGRERRCCQVAAASSSGGAHGLGRRGLGVVQVDGVWRRDGVDGSDEGQRWCSEGATGVEVLVAINGRDGGGLGGCSAVRGGLGRCGGWRGRSAAVRG